MVPSPAKLTLDGVEDLIRILNAMAGLGDFAGGFFVPRASGDVVAVGCLPGAGSAWGTMTCLAPLPRKYCAMLALPVIIRVLHEV